MADPTAPTLLFTRQQTADLLQVSVRTLDGLCRAGDGPPRIMLGERGVRFSRTALEKWIAEREEAAK